MNKKLKYELMNKESIFCLNCRYHKLQKGDYGYCTKFHIHTHFFEVCSNIISKIIGDNN